MRQREEKEKIQNGIKEEDKSQNGIKENDKSQNGNKEEDNSQNGIKENVSDTKEISNEEIEPVENKSLELKPSEKVVFLISHTRALDYISFGKEIKFCWKAKNIFNDNDTHNNYLIVFLQNKIMKKLNFGIYCFFFIWGIFVSNLD